MLSIGAKPCDTKPRLWTLRGIRAGCQMLPERVPSEYGPYSRACHNL